MSTSAGPAPSEPHRDRQKCLGQGEDMKMALRKQEPVEQGKLLERLSRASGSIAGWTEQLPGYVSARPSQQ